MNNKLMVGKVVGYFGIKNQIKIYLYNNKPTWLERGAFIGDKSFKVDIYPYKSKKNLCVGRVEGNVNIGDQLWIYRHDLEEGLIYTSDMIGAKILYKDKCIGDLIAIHDIASQNVFECSNGQYFNENQIDSITQNEICLGDNAI